VALIDDLRGLLGEQATKTLVLSYGGSKIYVPIAPNPEHRITKLIGAEPTAALCRRFGGEYIDVPIRMIDRKRILELAAQDWSASDIAREVGCTRRWVDRILHNDDPA